MTLPRGISAFTVVTCADSVSSRTQKSQLLQTSISLFWEIQVSLTLLRLKALKPTKTKFTGQKMEQMQKKKR